MPPRVTQHSEVPNSLVPSPTPAPRNLRARAPDVSSTDRIGLFAQISALRDQTYDI